MTNLRPLAPKIDNLPIRLAAKSVTKRSRHQHDAARWEAVKSTIVQLFIQEKKTANEVVEILRDDPSDPFPTSRRQLFVKLKEWGLGRNEKKLCPGETDGANQALIASRRPSVQAAPSPYADSLLLSRPTPGDGFSISQFASGFVSAPLCAEPIQTPSPWSQQYEDRSHLGHSSCGASNRVINSMGVKYAVPDPPPRRLPSKLNPGRYGPTAHYMSMTMDLVHEAVDMAEGHFHFGNSNQIPQSFFDVLQSSAQWFFLILWLTKWLQSPDAFWQCAEAVLLNFETIAPLPGHDAGVVPYQTDPTVPSRKGVHSLSSNIERPPITSHRHCAPGQGPGKRADRQHISRAARIFIRERERIQIWVQSAILELIKAIKEELSLQIVRVANAWPSEAKHPMEPEPEAGLRFTPTASVIPQHDQEPTLWPPMLSRPSTPLIQWKPDIVPPASTHTIEGLTCDGEDFEDITLFSC